MMFPRPGFKARRTDQHAQHFGQSGLVIIEPDETGQPFVRIDVPISFAGM
jgi:hypothetical protein